MSSYAFHRQNSTYEKSLMFLVAFAVFFTTTRCTSAVWPSGTKKVVSTRTPLRSPVIVV